MNLARLVLLGITLLVSVPLFAGGGSCSLCGDVAPPTPQRPTKTTQTGHVFTNRGDLSPGAWQDPSGMVWFPTFTLPENQHEAEVACRAKGYQLPSADDFKRLRSYMGASVDSWQGFTPQILFGLRNRTFWSSTVVPDINHHVAFAFQDGDLIRLYRDDRNSFLCVRPAAAR